MYWEIVAPLGALAVTAIASQTAVRFASRLRASDYQRFENQSKGALARQFGISSGVPSAAEDRRRTLSPLVKEVHGAAILAQTKYHNAVARSVGCLVAAFLALTLGTLPHQVWPFRLLPPEGMHAWKALLTWVDLIAIASVLALFWWGRVTNERWIVARAYTELLRQLQFVSMVFPTVIAPANDLEAQFAVEADRIKESLQRRPTTDIVVRIEQLWSEWKAKLGKHALTQADLSPDGLLVYLQHRVLRQLGWFTDSRTRLYYIAKRRKDLLLTLYCIAIGLAVIRLGIFIFGGGAPAYLLAALLVVIGLSGAMTAYYMNQNARSLIHRYQTQQRRIEQWLAAFGSRWNFRGSASGALDAAAKEEIRASILEFEDLMVEELIDWTDITSYDAIELGP